MVLTWNAEGGLHQRPSSYSSPKNQQAGVIHTEGPIQLLEIMTITCSIWFSIPWLSSLTQKIKTRLYVKVSIIHGELRGNMREHYCGLNIFQEVCQMLSTYYFYNPLGIHIRVRFQMKLHEVALFPDQKLSNISNFIWVMLNVILSIPQIETLRPGEGK